MFHHVDLPPREDDETKENGDPGLSVHKPVGSIIHRQSREPAMRWGAASARRIRNRVLSPVRPTDGNAPNVSSPTSSRGARHGAPPLRENRRNKSDENGSRRRPAEPGEQRRNRPLVGANKEANEQNHRQGRRIEARPARRKYSSRLPPILLLLMLLVPVLSSAKPPLAPPTEPTPLPSSRNPPGRRPVARSRPATFPLLIVC